MDAEEDADGDADRGLYLNVDTDVTGGTGVVDIVSGSNTDGDMGTYLNGGADVVGGSDTEGVSETGADVDEDNGLYLNVDTVVTGGIGVVYMNSGSNADGDIGSYLNAEADASEADVVSGSCTALANEDLVDLVGGIFRVDRSKSYFSGWS